MMNYIKSELYRTLRSKSVYILTGILVLLGVLYNVAIYLFALSEGPTFRYNSTSFSYSFIISSPVFFYVMAGVIAGLLFEGNRKNGNLKNSISFGISRDAIFIGKIIVSILWSIASCIIILAAYIISAELLLPTAGPATYLDIIHEVYSVFFICIGAIISMLLVSEYFDKQLTGAMVWGTIWYLIPVLISMLGLKFNLFYIISNYLPNSMYDQGVTINLSAKELIWDTAEGMLRTNIVGIAHIIVFTIAGILLLRKKDV